MPTVDMALLIYCLAHSFDVLHHLRCISLKELADSADEESISCEGAWLWVEDFDGFSLYSSLIYLRALVLLFSLLRKEGVDSVSPSMAGHMQSPHPALSHLQFLINS